VILDWSGTLVDDLPAVWEATNHVLNRAGRPTLSLEAFRTEFTLPVTEFYERVLPGVPAAQLEAWFHERFAQVQDRVTELAHARRFLEFCQRRGLRVFILTTVPEPYYQAQAALFGWTAWIEAAWTAVPDKRQAIGPILKRKGLDPRETLFVGDMCHDLDAAKAGGVTACAVLTGYQRLDQLRTGMPDWIVEHLGELEGLIERHGLDPSRRGGAVRAPVATVGALVFNPQGEVLLVQTRKWSNLWGIPGGKIKYGESSEAALRRELLEETGLALEEVRLVLTQDCIESTEFYRPEHFLLLNYTAVHRGTAPVRLNEEAQAYRWVPLEMAGGLALNGPTKVLLDHLRSERRVG
jgi:phosphoglycolate phosphatase-like HAD superfamily hydrolase/ADP-ribose pyrophosphatase YjhB (NUDIX family)